MHKGTISFFLCPGEKKNLPPPTSIIITEVNLFKTHWVVVMWLRPHTDIMWWCEIHVSKIFFLTVSPPMKEYRFLHEKGQCSYDSTRVKGVMKLFLLGIYHCCIDDDPPPGEKLHQSHEHARQMWTEFIKQEALHPGTATTTEVNTDIKQKTDTS